MKQEIRDVVDMRLKEIFGDEIDTLYFSNWQGKNVLKENPFKNMSLIDSILECLYLNEGNCSSSSINGFETHSGCNRSVIDIWRHLKHYNPEQTIYEVMDCLYKYVMNQDSDDYRISTFICGDIGRRVFILDDSELYTHDIDEYDTLYIDFYDWDNI